MRLTYARTACPNASTDSSSSRAGVELGLRLIRTGRVLSELRDPGSVFRIHFVEVEVDGEPDPREHDEVEWAGFHRLAELRLAPADAEFASMYVGS